MNIYFDKENFLSLISNKPSDSISFCEQIIKRRCKIQFNFSKEDIGDNSTAKLWMTRMAAGLKFDMSWNVNYPNRPLKSNNFIADGKESLRSVYLLCGEDVAKLKSKGIVLVGDVGEEVDVLSSLWYDDMQFIKEIFDEVNSWKDIRNYTSPTSDILIIDNFLAHHEELIEYNLIELLKILCSHSTQQKISIVIVMERDTSRKDEYYSRLVNDIEKKIGNVVSSTPYVTIVAAPPRQLCKHDRSIITNYKMFVSGDSFNYFDSSGKKITYGDFLSVYSLIDETTKSKADKIISEISGVIQHLLEINKECVYMRSSFKSNFIAF